MTIPGSGAVVADSIVAETGADMSRFPTARHLAPRPVWHQRPTSPPASAEPLAADTALRGYNGHLIDAAKTASRSHGTYLVVQYRQIGARRGPNTAAFAVANTLVWPSGTC